jgi:hypothetical protein
MKNGLVCQLNIHEASRLDISITGIARSNYGIITSAIKYGHIGDFVIYGMHGKD